MKKNLLLRLCLMMMIALLSFHSCRQDLLPEKETYNNSSAFQLTSKRISLNESKHRAKLLPELEKAEAEFKKLKTDAFGKTVSYGNGVSINTDNVTYIENGPNYHTYTFTVTRENATADAPLENLVLSPLTDGTYRELLFTYNLSATEKENITHGIPVDTQGKVSVTELTKGTYNTGGQLAKTSCNWVQTTIWIPCSSDDQHDGSNYWECEFVTSPSTANGTPPRAIVIEEYKCLLESDPGPGDGPGGSGTGGGDDGGGEGGTDPDDEPCNGNGVLTEPQQPGITDPNGCTGIPTMPTLPLLNTPCKRIKARFTETRFKEKYDTITKPGIHQLDRERAFYIRYPTVGTNIPPAYVEVNMSACSTDGDLPTFTEGMAGLMHTHNDLDCHGNIPIKVPSPTDIKTFFNTLMPEAGQYAGGYHNAYSLISTSGGNYMLMYNGTSYPGSINYYANEKLTKEYERMFTDLYMYNENVTQADIEKVFSKFMKEKINKPGLEIYKVTPTSAIKLEYDPNSPGSVKRTNCP